MTTPITHDALDAFFDASGFPESPADYTYNTYSLNDSSAKFGYCESCGKHVSEVYKLRTFWAGDTYEYKLSTPSHGHQDCLIKAAESLGMKPEPNGELFNARPATMEDVYGRYELWKSQKEGIDQ
jgi:hypothetical protein